MKQTKRVHPYFSDKQVKEMDKLIGELGATRADVLKNVFLFYLEGKKVKK